MPPVAIAGHVHAELAHHRGEAFHEALDGELGGVIGIAERQSHDTIQTRHGDDSAGPGRAHGRQDGFGDARDPEEVELHRLRQLIQLFQRSAMSGARVVDQQVDTAQVDEDGADARVDRLIAGDVEGPELHSGQFVGDLPQTIPPSPDGER
jgi:hypothetical protein